MSRAANSAFSAVILIALLLLAGCGSDGKDGAPGAPAGVDIANAGEINAVITDASVGSPVTVSFALTDENGNPIRNLPAGAISFKLAKLVPGTDGNNPSYWQSYINNEEDPLDPPPVPPQDWPGTETTVQAGVESGSAGALVENNDGTYTYTFSFDIDAVTDPIVVEYVPTLTHRVTFEIRGYVPVNNPVYDWRPSDSATDGLFTREIVKIETCNNCHENLTFHGGARNETQDCVTCHNPGTTDANTGNTVDMTVMIHKIHMGEDLPSIVFNTTVGAKYSIYGRNNSEHRYSELLALGSNPGDPGTTDGVPYPQDIRTCRNCHNENDPQTPDAANWFNNPSAQACGSCHDDVNFTTGENHGSGIANPNCIGCHTGTIARVEVREAHRILTFEKADEYRFDILDVTFTPPSGGPSTPSVRFAISNPQLGDPDDQTARYDLENDAELAASSLNLRLAWNTADYLNIGAGTSNAQPQSAAVFSAGVLQAIPVGDLTYTLNVGSVPDGTTGSGVVVFEGGVKIADTSPQLTAPVDASRYYFSITDSSPVERREPADLVRCNDCHERIIFHGSNRNNLLEACQVCHNANAARRGDPSLGPMDIKHFVHRLHNDLAASEPIHKYPQRTSNCLACHTDDGFYPVTSDSGVLATSINRGSDPGLPDTNTRYSANAATCGVCHTDADAQVHMEQNGSSFDACQEDDGTLRQRVDVCGAGGDKTGALVTESCSVCHAEGRSADTAVAHKLAL